MAPRLAIVTGGNRGIGLEIVRQLAEHGLDVVLTSRGEAEGRRAASKLGVRFHTLDVTSGESRDALAEAVGGGLDVLVNNAGIALDGFDEGVARRTIDTNFWGAVHTTDRLLPLIRTGGRIVMVSSGLGTLSSIREPLRARLASPTLDRAELTSLVESFVRDVGKGTHAAAGWPSSAYGVSKVVMNAFTRLLARELGGDARGILVNAVCPGWVRTQMGGASAPRSVEDGARTPVFAALLPAGAPTGTLFRDEAPVPF